MPTPVGSPVYNSIGNSTIADTNEIIYESTSFTSGTVGSNSLVVGSISGFSIDQYIIVGQGSLAEILQIQGATGNTLTVFPTIGKSHSSGDPVFSKVARQVMSIGDPTSGSYIAAVGINGLATYEPLTSGVWNYYAGTSGTVTVTAGQRILGITAIAGSSGSTLSINGGSNITITANGSLVFTPLGNLTAPTLVFTNTLTYVVEVVT